MKEMRTIIGKEWAEILRNKLIVSMLIGIPLLMAAIPIGILYATTVGAISESDLEEMSRMLANPMFSSMEPREALQSMMASQMMLLFLMMPIILPVTIAAYSIVGEKLSRSLEPLLATPITTGQLLMAKSFAAAAPAVLLTWLCYGVFLIFARILAVSDRVFAIFVHPMWLIAMFVLAPLLTVLAVNVGIMVSSRVNDPRAAEQLGSLVVIPFMALFIPTIAGFIFLNTTTFVVISALVALVDVALVYLGIVLFQRETILTRWK